MKPIKTLREYADKLEKIEKEFNLVATCITGQAVFYEDTSWNFDKVDKAKIWKYAVENRGFIGIMPNQNRPTIIIYAEIHEVPICIYNYHAFGVDTYDGGFLREYDNIIKECRANKAPKWIIQRIRNLHKLCTTETKNLDLVNKKKELEKELEKINNKLNGC